MSAFKKSTKWMLVVLLLIAIAPILITVYEVIFTKSKSVVFLGHYHPAIVMLVICCYVFLLCLGLYWLVRQIVLINKIKKEKMKAELMLLKSQVGPHFFFNMLNNLYGLVAKDAQKAQALILKLSDLMRYSIYEGEKDTVDIQYEIDFLKTYIALHKMRYHKHIHVDFNYDINGNQKIVPLLFIILLENAFKHGVENLRENAYIKINLTVKQGQLDFIIENNFEKSQRQSGIGLKNLKRRLELTYPNRHDLAFSIEGNRYMAKLILAQL